jgi:phage terminase large subunit
MELDIRTRLFTFLDYNPVAEFWIHDKVIPFPENTFIHSTYLDAINVLEGSVVRNIESNKEKDKNWWNVYGLGNTGRIEGLVYPNLTIVDSVPAIDKACVVYGLDFGYASHPTVLVKNTIQNDNLYSEELIYETGMTNQQIANMMEEFEIKKNYDIIIADSAEPKSIEEIHQYGFNILPVKKGADSVEHGHQRVNQFKQYWTKSSTNCIKEQRNFMYIKDKSGKLTEKTTHFFSHGMDARRYAISYISEQSLPGVFIV